MEYTAPTKNWQHKTSHRYESISSIQYNRAEHFPKAGHIFVKWVRIKNLWRPTSPKEANNWRCRWNSTRWNGYTTWTTTYHIWLTKYHKRNTTLANARTTANTQPTTTDQLQKPNSPTIMMKHRFMTYQQQMATTPIILRYTLSQNQHNLHHIQSSNLRSMNSLPSQVKLRHSNPKPKIHPT